MLSELRGMTSAWFALLALNGFVLARQADVRGRSIKLLIASVFAVVCAALCKPSAAVLPMVALVIDRVVFRTPWRKTLFTVAVWTAAVLPFVLITRQIQPVPALSSAGQFDQAESAFRRCIAVAPTLAGAHTGLGIVLAQTGRLADALTEFREAVAGARIDRVAATLG
jgi:tetratricopeptide (TPR) repeat protein